MIGAIVRAGASRSLRLFTARSRSSPSAIGPRSSPSHRAKTAAVETATRGLTSRSEEHTSELQSLMRTSYAVFCLKKKITTAKNSTRKLTHHTTISETNNTIHDHITDTQ